MHLEGQFAVSASQADVYAFLADPRMVSRHMPDVTQVDIQDDDHFTVTARVGISHIKGTMVMKLEVRDRRPPIGTTVVGRGTGLGSVVDMTTSFSLEPGTGPAGALPRPADGRPHAAEGTIVHWRGDVTISGTLAAFGPQGLLDRIARKNVDTFIEGIRNGLEARSTTPDAGR
jgi:carbon monoxide dehydrogenase subunit G